MVPDLSIVVVHWNVPDLLRGCLRSIAADRAGSGLDARVIVVDCASPSDRWRAVVAELPDAETVALADNRGYAAGCNAGIARASGEAVLVLNPDTELRPGALRVLWDVLHTAGHIGMVAPLLLNPDGSLQSHGYRFPGVANMLFDLVPLHPRLVESPLNGRVPPGDGRLPVKIDYPLGAAMLARRAAIAEVGPLDEAYWMYCEEVDWARRMAAAGWTTLLAPAARVVHHGGQSTGQRPDAMYEALWTSRARYFARWGTRRQRRVIAVVVAAGTRVADLHADPGRRAANARIRGRFRESARAGR
jgi:GT2 family glycosyltransferase